MSSLTGEELMKGVTESVNNDSTPQSSGQGFGNAVKNATLAPDAQTQIDNYGKNLSSAFQDIGGFFQGMFQGAKQSGASGSFDSPQDQGRKLPDPDNTQQPQHQDLVVAQNTAKATDALVQDPEMYKHLPIDQILKLNREAHGMIYQAAQNVPEMGDTGGGSNGARTPQQINVGSDSTQMGVRQGQQAFDKARERAGIDVNPQPEDPNAQINSTIDQTKAIKAGMREQTAPASSFLQKIGNGDVC